MGGDAKIIVSNSFKVMDLSKSLQSNELMDSDAKNANTGLSCFYTNVDHNWKN